MMKKQIRKFFSFFISAAIFMSAFVPVFAHPVDVCNELAVNSACKVATKYDCSRIAPGFNRRNLAKFQYLCQKGVVQVSTNLKDISVRYTMQRRAIKEDYILRSRKACNSFVLKYDIGNFRAEQINNQTISLYSEELNKEILIEAPYMTDAAGARSNKVSLKILSLNDGVLIVNLSADYEWLQSPERHYPVEIDPIYEFPERILQLGDQGKDVSVLKSMLFEAGFGAGVTKHDALNDMHNNRFTKITEKFVLVFQREMGIRPTGRADEGTLDALRTHLRNEGILDTEMHVEDFFKRVEERSREAGFLSRVNKADVVTSLAISVVSTGLGMAATYIAPPVTMPVAMAGGAIAGSLAGGISEYVQQRQAGKHVDKGRVAIKTLTGAAQGFVSAIPGVSMGNAFSNAVSVGKDVMIESVASGAKEMIVPVAKACFQGGVVLAKAGVKDALIATASTVATDTAGNFACKVKSGQEIKEAAKDAVVQGVVDATMVPVAVVTDAMVEGVMVGVAATTPAAVAAMSTADTHPVKKPHYEPVQNPEPKPKPAKKDRTTNLEKSIELVKTNEPDKKVIITPVKREVGVSNPVSTSEEQKIVNTPSPVVINTVPSGNVNKISVIKEAANEVIQAKKFIDDRRISDSEKISSRLHDLEKKIETEKNEELRREYQREHEDIRCYGIEAMKKHREMRGNNVLGMIQYFISEMTNNNGGNGSNTVLELERLGSEVWETIDYEGNYEAICTD
ncbi:MAG: peptidoglycan-binding domain-containing protein [Clostridia bacterium]|nr:peptidoglycan-binding domain-containing protein [Clostridia bacterium]